MTHEEQSSEFLRHTPCTNCGSSDANSEYTDGHTHCFTCGTHTGSSTSGSAVNQTRKRAAGLIEGTAGPLLARGITEDTCRHFNYMKGTHKSRNVQIAPYYDANGNMVAQKLRFPDKTFAWLGDQTTAVPFGANKFPKGGKMLVVTEGEIDALAMSQVQGNKWPVVSIGCGAGPQVKKYIAKHRDYFSSFEKVVIMFDNDEPGRDAAVAAAEVIGSAKAVIAQLPEDFKDAGEMLLAGKTDALITAMWHAQKFTPSGIVELSSLRAQVMEGVKWGQPWPWQRLTELTYGRRTGEVYCLGAGTGAGKTDVFTQIIDQTINELNEPVGVFFLEQAPRETAMRIAGKRAKQRFHVPDAGWTMEQLSDTWNELEKSGKVFLYDSFGVNDWADIEDRIRYLAQAEDVKHFFIDHLTALAAVQPDERKALAEIMASIGGLVKELDICIYLISHLATPDGTPHEEGGRVMLRHFKGARDIGFWSHYAFGLERNQQDEDPVARRTTTFRIVKDRYTGQATGETFLIRYDQDTGMLDEVTFENEASGFVDETKGTVDTPTDF